MIILKHLKYIFLLGLVVTLGCKDDDISIDDIEISVSENELTIKSHQKDHKIYYFLVSENTTVVIDWAPSIDDQSPAISPGEEFTIQYEAIPGYEVGEDQVLFYYWRAVKEKGNLVPGPVHTITIDLD